MVIQLISFPLEVLELDMRYLATLLLGAAAALFAEPSPVAAQIDARMFRYPDISATHITFVYAGDIWIVPKEGGVASHLSSPAGEEAFPRFSPDGSKIAFSANYDGNLDVYAVPAMGGDPVRITYHPGADRLVDWHPDGTRVLFASQRESGRQRFNQFFLASVRSLRDPTKPALVGGAPAASRGGGLPEKLPVPYGEFAAFSPDGKELVYLPQSQAFRTWKRYRGGWAPDVWLFNLASLDAKNISANDAIDEHPMWHGNTIYFTSDRGPAQRHNIWAYDRSSGATRQVTHFDEFDITFPAIGPSDIVFEAGGRLYRLDLQSEKVAEVPIRVITDRSTLKTRLVPVGESIQSASVSPTGKRAVFEARGDAFTVPAEHGPVLDVTRSSGVAERYPRWSPDGKTLAYWTDRTGEYELALRPVAEAGKERIVTKLGPGYRYPPHWSPDSKRMAFADEKLRIHLYDIARNEVKAIDRSPVFMDNGTLERLAVRWSADSRWIVWARPDAETRNGAVFLYDTKTAARHQVSSGYFQDSSPVFDPGGKYLYFFSNRQFEPVYSDFDNSWTYANATQIVAVPLRKDVPSPLAARNDVEGEDEAEEETTEEKKDEASEPEEPEDEQDENDEAGEKKVEIPTPVEIDVEGFEARAVVLPPKPGNYADLFAVEGKV
ncbi:MAG: S41 family peptidase, partial [Vicinamibacteraceae bacterium]